MIAIEKPAKNTSEIRGTKRETIMRWVNMAPALTMSLLLNNWNFSQEEYNGVYFAVAVKSTVQSWKSFFSALDPRGLDLPAAFPHEGLVRTH